jgi:hypothetical protein
MKSANPMSFLVVRQTVVAELVADVLTYNPRNKTGHTACLACLQGSVDCPFCRTTFSPHRPQKLQVDFSEAQPPPPPPAAAAPDSRENRVRALEVELAKAISMDDTAALPRLQREAQDWISHAEQTGLNTEVYPN